MTEEIRAEMVDAMLHGVYDRFPHVILHMVIDSVRSYSMEQMRSALSAAVADHPVLCCRYRPGLWRDTWATWDGPTDRLLAIVEDPASVETVTRHVTGMTFAHRNAPPFAVTYIPKSKGSRLILSAHHMLADGGGIKAVANSFASHLYGTEPNPPVHRDRGHLQVTQGIRLTDWPRIGIEIVREAVRPAAILKVRRVSERFAEGNGSPRPSWRTVVLNHRATDAFHRYCRQRQATINDGLVAALLRLASRRLSAGPVAAAYTIDLRRYLRPPVSTVTNLHGVALVVAPRPCLRERECAVRAVSAVTTDQKSKLPGLGYLLLPVLTFGWLPHALLRVVAGPALAMLVGYMERALALTNIGPLDEALAPFGEDARAAYIVGPFIHGMRTPTVTASGFRGMITLCVGGTGTLGSGVVPAFADELREEMEGWGRG